MLAPLQAMRASWRSSSGSASRRSLRREPAWRIDDDARARTRRAASPFRRGLPSRLEELDRIPVRIFHLDLPASRPDLHLVAELHSGFLQRVDPLREIAHAEDHSIPAA